MNEFEKIKADLSGAVAQLAEVKAELNQFAFESGFAFGAYAKRAERYRKALEELAVNHKDTTTRLWAIAILGESEKEAHVPIKPTEGVQET